VEVVDRDKRTRLLHHGGADYGGKKFYGIGNGENEWNVPNNGPN